MQLGLKVDVDTFVGTRDGVPRLLATFADLGVRATFFVCVGPDNSGKAIRRVFRRGFMTKMRNSSALKLYGVRTMLSGTLLPAPHIGTQLRDTLRAIADAGHEVGLHAYDHVRWHDCLPGMAAPEVSAELLLGTEAFRAVFERDPRCAAAPGWTCTATSLQAQDDLELEYQSDCRGHGPFLPRADGYTAATPQLPTTLPTMDELLGTGLSVAESADHLTRAELAPDYNVFTLHAEVEGRYCPDAFSELLAAWRARGVLFCALGELAEAAAGGGLALPTCPLTNGTLPGRAGTVAMQGETVAGEPGGEARRGVRRSATPPGTGARLGPGSARRQGFPQGP